MSRGCPQARRIIMLAAPSDVWQEASHPCAAARADLRPVPLPALHVRARPTLNALALREGQGCGAWPPLPRLGVKAQVACGPETHQPRSRVPCAHLASHHAASPGGVRSTQGRAGPEQQLARYIA